MAKSNGRRRADALQYVALIGFIGLVGLAAFRPFDIPAWAHIGLLAVAVGASPAQLTEWFRGFQVVRRNEDKDD